MIFWYFLRCFLFHVSSKFLQQKLCPIFNTTWSGRRGMKRNAPGPLEVCNWDNRNQHVWHGRICPKKLNCFVGFAFIKSIWVPGIATKILDFELPRLPELQCAQLLKVKKFSWNSDVLGTACDRRGCWFVSHAKFNSHSLGEFLCKKRCAFGRCCDYGDWEKKLFQNVWKNWTFS